MASFEQTEMDGCEDERIKKVNCLLHLHSFTHNRDSFCICILPPTSSDLEFCSPTDGTVHSVTACGCKGLGFSFSGEAVISSRGLSNKGILTSILTNTLFHFYQTQQLHTLCLYSLLTIMTSRSTPITFIGVLLIYTSLCV